MKVFLLAAGRGERLGDLTKDKPKCLIEVNGKPILDRWLGKLADWKVSDVLLNLSYKSDVVMDYLKTTNYNNMLLTIYKEQELLGTARTLHENRKFVKGEYYFAVIYSDVWTTFDIRKMVTFHKRRPSMVTLGLCTPKSCMGKGVAVVKEGLVVGFEEKTKHPKSKYVWAGILIAHPSMLSVLRPEMKDIAFDLLPELAKTGKMSAFYIDSYLEDIGGSPEQLQKIREDVKGMGLLAL